MSKKLSHCSAVEDLEHDQPTSHCRADQSANPAPGCRNKTESGQRNGNAASSSPESGSLNGDGKRSGKSRRRRKRSSNAESRSEGMMGKTKNEEQPNTSDPRAVLTGLQAECANVWFERSTYDRAESLYHRWLLSCSNAVTNPKQPSPAPREQSNSPPTVAPSSSGLSCHHGDQVACHHVVQAVWVNKATFDQAESRFVEVSTQPSVPNSLDLPPLPNRSIAPRTPDEGYQSLAPTPVTPSIHQTAVTPTNRQSINGLPHVPVELLRDVWLEKPLYDRAEAAFYQNLHGNNSSKWSSCASTSRGNDHPQSLMEEEEEEEEEQGEEEMMTGERRVVQQSKAEIFHALHPIQEEEEPAEVPDKEEVSGAGVCYFLHPGSELVWLDKWRYDAAESQFHHCSGHKAAVVEKGHKLEADASNTHRRDNNMSAVDFLAQEKIWFDKPRYDEAEKRFYEHVNCHAPTAQTPKNKDVGANSILQDIARARENIQKSLAGSNTNTNTGGGAADQEEIISRIKSLELENLTLHKVVDNLRAELSKLECRVAVLEKSPAAVTPAPPPAVPYTNGTANQQTPSAPVKEEEDEDDDFDLFGSDEDEEAEKLKEQRLKEYAEKKAKKPAVIAKSSILLDVKPWDDETDMAKLEECVRSVQADGLLWGTSKLVPVGYGIKKLQIACVVEDDKVGTDLLEEEITKFEDYVQSVDVAAFNKI